MHLDDFKTWFDARIEEMRAVASNLMVNDGDVETESQRICVLNRIAALERAINGTEQADLRTDHPEFNDRWPAYLHFHEGATEKLMSVELQHGAIPKIRVLTKQ